MKNQYIRPVLEVFHVRMERALVAGSKKATELSRIGNAYEPFGNESWVNEGYKPGIGINDFTREGGAAIEIDPNGTGLDSRSKGGLWTDDDD